MQNEFSFDSPPPSGQPAESLIQYSIKGEVRNVIYASSDGQFAVLRIRELNGGEVILCGALRELQAGQEITAKGRWENHREYGRQFRVTEFQEVLPSTEDGIRRYLASGIVPGIGPKYAERIVKKFGVETLSIMDNTSARLLEIPGIGKNKIQKIRAAWQEHAQRRNTYVYLQGLGIGMSYCHRLLQKYGDNTPGIIKENPYRLAAEVRGIGFKMADSIAQRLNIAKDHPFRLGAGVVYLLHELADRQGHVCYPKSRLIEKAAEMLEVAPPIAELGLQRALADGAVKVVGAGVESAEEVVYGSLLYGIETKLARLIGRKIDQPVPAHSDLAKHATAQWEILNPEQQQAVINSFNQSLSIITGGPGVGKTTVVREIVAIAHKLNLKLALTAPTGRAAKRMSEASQFPAQTIHRLLKWLPDKQTFLHNEERQLRLHVVIVDEVSMIDLPLAYNLFAALAPETLVVLVGDRDQLPSIGPGLFLADLIACGRVPVTHLIHVYRQAENSRIIHNAHQVNQGIIPNLQTPSGDAALSDFYWINQEDPEKIPDLICQMVAQRIPQRFQLSPRQDIQVLTPMNRGVCGARHLNSCLQNILNPLTAANPTQLTSGDLVFRVGDRVMQVSNNYDLEVFNGELGTIMRIESEPRQFSVLYDMGEVRYAFDDILQLRLAYAATIHKAQGSEFPAVIVPVVMPHLIMLKRKLIYTAMTRAARLLILIGSRKALAIAVKNYRVATRYSRLADRLINPEELKV